MTISLLRLFEKAKGKTDLLLLYSSIVAIGATFILTIPVGYGSDETVQAYKASAVASSALFSQKIYNYHTDAGTPVTIYGDFVPKSIVEGEGVSSGTKPALSCVQNVCKHLTDTQKRLVQDKLSQPLNADNKILLDFWGVNAYLFVGYIPSAVGFFIAQVFNTHVDTAIHLGKLTNLLTAAFLVCSAFYILRASKLRWILAAVSMLPISIVCMSSLGTDGILFSLSALLLAIIIRAVIDGRLSTRLKIVLWSVAVIIPLIKLPYLILSASALFFPSIFSAKTKGLAYRCIFALLILLPGILWNISSADMTRTQYLSTHFGDSEPNASEQVRFVSQHPVKFLGSFVNMFIQDDPINDLGKMTQQVGVAFPNSILFASFIPLLVAILYGASEQWQSRKTSQFASLLLILMFTLLAGLATAMYLTYNPVGESSIHGVQGRYLLPLIPFIAIALSMIIDCKLQLGRKTRVSVMAISVAMPILALLSYLVVIR